MLPVTVLVALGDVVAQLAEATGRHQTEDAAVPGSNPAPPQSPKRGQDTYLTVYHTKKKKISASARVKNSLKNFFSCKYLDNFFMKNMCYCCKEVFIFTWSRIKINLDPIPC
jgi:hypothetical protein